MATTPTDRETMLSRRLRLDIDTATYPTVAYNQLRGIEEFNPIIEPRTQDDESYDDDGWGREATTGGAWRLEVKFKHSTGADGTTVNAVQAFLRTKNLAVISGTASDGEFGVRWYDDAGRVTGQEFEGRAFVKSWTRDKNTSADTEVVSVVLQGQGPLTAITNPNANMDPVVTSVSPTGGGTAGGNLVNIYGTHFLGATDVDFASDAADYTIVSDSHIVAISPAHAAGMVQVKVTTPEGVSANTSADDYTYA